MHHLFYYYKGNSNKLSAHKMVTHSRVKVLLFLFNAGTRSYYNYNLTFMIQNCNFGKQHTNRESQTISYRGIKYWSFHKTLVNYLSGFQFEMSISSNHALKLSNSANCSHDSGLLSMLFATPN